MIVIIMEVPSGVKGQSPGKCIVLRGLVPRSWNSLQTLFTEFDCRHDQNLQISHNSSLDYWPVYILRCGGSKRHFRWCLSPPLSTCRFVADSVTRALTLDSGPHHVVTLLYHDLTANFQTVLFRLLHHPLGIASLHTFAPHPHTLHFS